MFKFLLARVVGNDLPPKDKPGEKLQSLRFVIEQDRKAGIPCLWVLNRIVCPRYKKQVSQIIGDAEILDIPFVVGEFNKTANKKKQIQYLTNINPARNHLIAEGLLRAEFVFSIDQDCFFTPDLWQSATDFIEQNPKDYYGLVSKRIVSLNSVWEEPDNEPMLVFGRKSTMRFDESLTFGNADKIDLLRRLGYGDGLKNTGDLCKTCGYVLHIGYDEVLEKNIKARQRARTQGIENLLQRAKRCGTKIL